MKTHPWFVITCLFIMLAACRLPSLDAAPPSQTPAGTAIQTLPPARTPIDTSTATVENTTIPSPTFTPSPSHTSTPSPSPTHTPLPTYVKLRGKVIIDQAVCHYGPGAPYLYKYGVYKGSNLEVLRRVEGGNYIEIQAIGGNNPCWVKVDYLELKGHFADLEPVRFDQVKLPMSPYYAPPTGVSALRNGNTVTFAWHPLVLRAGDDSEQTPYIVEAWVCQGKEMVFLPLGSYQTTVEVTDESGCNEPSRARLLAAEKHGYTRPVEFSIPTASTEAVN
jgi:hypothetical protein